MATNYGSSFVAPHKTLAMSKNNTLALWSLVFWANLQASRVNTSTAIVEALPGASLPN
jgi:hypothetical protein